MVGYNALIGPGFNRLAQSIGYMAPLPCSSIIDLLRLNNLFRGFQKASSMPRKLSAGSKDHADIYLTDNTYKLIMACPLCPKAWK